MSIPEDLRVLARDGLRKIAARELKARRPRMDAVFYLLDAMRLFRGKSLQEIQEITFEIGMLSKYGLDINDPQESHVLRALPGEDVLWVFEIFMGVIQAAVIQDGKVIKFSVNLNSTQITILALLGKECKNYYGMN